MHEALDTTTPGGRLVCHVFAALAEFIRELIVEGTRGRPRRRPRPRYPPRPATCHDPRADPSRPRPTHPAREHRCLEPWPRSGACGYSPRRGPAAPLNDPSSRPVWTTCAPATPWSPTCAATASASAACTRRWTPPRPVAGSSSTSSPPWPSSSANSSSKALAKASTPHAPAVPASAGHLPLPPSRSVTPATYSPGPRTPLPRSPGCSVSPATRSISTCPRSPPPELYPTPTYPPRRRQPHELIATPATAPAPGPRRDFSCRWSSRADSSPAGSPAGTSTAREDHR